MCRTPLARRVAFLLPVPFTSRVAPWRFPLCVAARRCCCCCCCAHALPRHARALRPGAAMLMLPLSSSPSPSSSSFSAHGGGRGGGSDDACGAGGKGRGGGGGSGGSGGGGPPESLLLAVLAAYLRVLARYPLRTKVLTSAVLTCVSDALAQLVENRVQPSASWLDVHRLAALFIVGGALTAPMFHFLYMALERWVPSSGGMGNIVAQLAVDQLVAAPLWLLAFFGGVAVVEGGKWPDVQKQVRRDFVPAVKLTWTVFPVVQMASFAFVPPPLRVLVLNVVDLVFTGALSYIKHRPHPVLVVAEREGKAER